MLEAGLKVFLSDLPSERLRDRDYLTIDISGECESLYPLVSSVYLEKSTGDEWDFENPEFYFFRPSTRCAEIESFDVSSMRMN